MARFVMANRRAGKFRKPLKEASRESLDLTYAESLEANVNVIGDTAPNNEEARRVIIFDADPREVASKRTKLPPDVMLEPELMRYPSNAPLFASPWLPFSTNCEPFAIGSVGTGTSLALTLRGNDQPLVNADVTLYLRTDQGRSISQQQTSSANGQVGFDFGSFWIPTAVIVEPCSGFWSFVVRGPRNGAIINVPVLPVDGPLAWWHQVINIKQYDPTLGAGIRVGVIDTRVGPHTYLDNVNTVGAFIQGSLDQDTTDVSIHGTHVCGIIGARPDNTSHYAGIAPGVDLYCARVFARGQGANQGDIADAIEALSMQYQVDLINMSLGSENKSEIEQDAIVAAIEAGTLCLCAAGNSAGSVQYPAALPESVAVSALGREGWGPEGALASTCYPLERSHYGREGLYLANFSCSGNEITCCAPGVGIISTLPEVPYGHSSYAALNGTSMACPVATGALAALLAGRQDYIALPRDFSRAEQARTILRNSCKDVGLAANLGGRGLPTV